MADALAERLALTSAEIDAMTGIRPLRRWIPECPRARTRRGEAAQTRSPHQPSQLKPDND